MTSHADVRGRVWRRRAEPRSRAASARRRDVAAHPGHAPAWIAGVAVLMLLVAAEAFSGDRVELVPFLVLPPIVTAISGTTRETTAVAVAAVVTAVVTGAWTGTLTTPQHLVRLNVVAMVGGFAVYTVALRARREERLARVSAVAEVAQRAVLRPVPSRIDDVLIATRYRSATQSAGIGGDLYEAVDTNYGVRLIVGDVRGKGLEAVRLAAGVLGAFRLAARNRLTLADVVRDLDGYVALDGGEEDFVTAVVVEFGRTTTVVSCGHHPPVVLTARAGVLSPAVPSTMPLGLGSRPAPTEIPLEPGDRLFLCTDGLLEARDASGAFFPFDDAIRAAARERDVDAVARTVETRLRRHVGGALDDDLAIVVASRTA